jgi:predicted urease superfamily metal-dependent hydrolase
MTKKQYRSAMGKTVDMGSLLLQNESVRAVGNMGVNARGDTISSTNKVIEKKARQVQRHNQRSTNVSNTPVATSTSAVKKARVAELSPVVSEEDIFTDLPEDNDVVVDKTAEPALTTETTTGGLASAIARSRTVQQQLEKTPRQLAKQTPGVRKF